jgi:acyl-CoA-binding protein
MKNNYTKSMKDAEAGYQILIDRKNESEYGKQYALTGGTGTKSILNGNTWAESEVVDKFDTVEKMKTSGKEQIARYIEVVDDLIAKYWTDTKLTYKECPKASVQYGSKYAKVIADRSVHTFIDLRNGNILKAASYAAPAKNGVRGNIFADDCGRSVITNFGAKYLK